MRQRLSRGSAGVDARLDLHGLTQAAAKLRLENFLRNAQARGHSLVLVITGKGAGDDPERGVLRRQAPHWLALPEFRSLVVGFEEAGRGHGGAGALYVRVRRAR
jgi:DNA-nicking Smr family endonuclease